VAVVVLAVAASAPLAGAAARPLSQQLLSVADLHRLYLGAGGSKWATFGSVVTPARDCTYRYMEPVGVRQTASASTIDIYNHDVPIFQEKAATYSNSSKAYRGIVATLVRCLGRTTVGQPTFPVEHVSRLSAPHFGDESVGFTLGFTVAAQTFVSQLLIVRKGSIVAAIEVEKPSALFVYTQRNDHQLLFLAGKAVAKLS
jgi:hypothetical protein